MRKDSFDAGLRTIGATWDGNLPEAKRIVDDTREVRQGDIFVLRQGASELSPELARKYARSAEQSGAVAMIADPRYDLDVTLPIIHLTDPHLKLCGIAEAFYGRPSMGMKVIAVTGTNGKTTTTYLLESLCQSMGLRVGVMGTISHRYPGYSEASINTTPGTLKLYRLMSEMADAGCDIVAMEVSSHGIMQGRVDGVAFDAAIWNNLGTDHLDFHKTREAYAAAKQRLFNHYLFLSHQAGKSPVAVGNLDDEEVMAHILGANPAVWGDRVLSFSASGNDQADVVVHALEWRKGAWNFEICYDGNSVRTKLPLIGQYNVANATGAVAALLGLGYSLEDLGCALGKIAQIPGRMECVSAEGPTVIVDFAHTPEAMQNALEAARGCVADGGKLCIVFGAGGDRDPSKRPMMGEIAAKCADVAIVTSDNPRTENPLAIIDGIVAGIPKSFHFDVEADRAKAIENAILQANPQDVVMVVGKGHEDYQILGTEKIHFDDREQCKNSLNKKLAHDLL
ncbi:MAG: UDP-N-acetylmuramoyl-L-alanyl-D-glutamate--2,6-diaminopimelate ligase [Proteobacteria bacterium]|nr:UDP-N-acetylmuramoyl-L-alanyl-D-glutamate--2,6-diaminopimelate ligase [Pseudomonadota bacterium]